MIKILKSKEELNLGFALRIEVFVKEQKPKVETPEVDLDKEVIAGRNAILEAIKSGR